MSAWRRIALQALPELRAELQRSEVSLHEAFFAILQLCQQAHSDANEDLLKRIHGFAAWCARQPDKSLWNPAGVAFYEHLADSRPMLKSIPRWVPKDVFEDIATLLESRIGSTGVAELRKRYNEMDSQ